MIAGIIALVAYGFDEIGKLIKSPSTSTAAQVLKAIELIYDAVNAAVARKVSPEDAQERIQILVASVAENDAAADAALDSKFPTGSE